MIGKLLKIKMYVVGEHKATYIVRPTKVEKIGITGSYNIYDKIKGKNTKIMEGSKGLFPWVKIISIDFLEHKPVYTDYFYKLFMNKDV